MSKPVAPANAAPATDAVVVPRKWTAGGKKFENEKDFNDAAKKAIDVLKVTLVAQIEPAKAAPTAWMEP